jgi:hypothetical protein
MTTVYDSRSRTGAGKFLVLRQYKMVVRDIQFEISAVRNRFGSPCTRNIFIVARDIS